VDTLSHAAPLRARIAAWRREGARIGFVPTMGNLHGGHYSLLEVARERADKVVASIFVNPTQFGPSEDFSGYPRTPDADRDALRAHACDLLFLPTVEEIYPNGSDASVRVEVPVVSDTLEGALRPGHFAGVATVVTKLFNLVQPDLAVFGEKDYQQLLVVRRLVQELALPIGVVAAPTRREPNGLAMSSRNQYLSAEERERASAIFRTLNAMAAGVRAATPLAAVEADAERALQHAGLTVQYAVVRNADDLSVPVAGQGTPKVALIAARLGRARLIDNLLLDL
jgi:pantoate--beta-alanine ligase